MSNLKKYTISQLEKELAERLLEKEENETIPVVFGYSKRNFQFDTKLISINSVADIPKISNLMLRARFNAHREIRIFSFRINKNMIEEFNNQLFILEDEEEIFNKLPKSKLLELDF
jgi:hypothetical protein